ncbi:GIY-YIG nuclease family protein [Streptomyces sp. NBC_00425]|uniref:GIY-YIG nuclease family protein n=1 Tax=Streptomyces sp. NBC_00425 TaxID=2975740 RepID=UPI002E218217
MINDQARHFPARPLDRDASWDEYDMPGGVDTGNLLYRFYDGDRLPLYIGKTTVTTARLEQHRRHAEWYGLVEYVALSLYPSHALLLRAERAAIRHEQPRFNKVDRRGRDRVKLNLHGPAEAAAVVLLDQADPEFLAELVRLLGLPDRALLAAAPPAADWDAIDWAEAERGRVLWARDLADDWCAWLDQFGHRQPTLDEGRAFHGRLIAEARRGSLEPRQFRLLARVMAQHGRYDIDVAFPSFVALYRPR